MTNRRQLLVLAVASATVLGGCDDDFELKTVNSTAVSGRSYSVDTTSGAITVTLPSAGTVTLERSRRHLGDEQRHSRRNHIDKWPETE